VTNVMSPTCMVFSIPVGQLSSRSDATSTSQTNRNHHRWQRLLKRFKREGRAGAGKRRAALRVTGERPFQNDRAGHGGGRRPRRCSCPAGSITRNPTRAHVPLPHSGSCRPTCGDIAVVLAGTCGAVGPRADGRADGGRECGRGAGVYRAGARQPRWIRRARG
jgi:hypothetical protein